MSAKAKQQEPDWKKIALHLSGRLAWVIQHIQAKGTGTVFNTKTGELKHWKEDLADALEMMPNTKVDRDAMHALELPKKQRDKFFKDREKAAATKTEGATA